MEHPVKPFTCCWQDGVACWQDGVARILGEEEAHGLAPFGDGPARQCRGREYLRIFYGQE